MQQAALEGITVLDLGQIYNGPYASFLLAMAGARVIKVESLIGEALRGRGDASSAAYPFAMLNQNKESLSIDLKSEEGRALFRGLVKKADVVLENFSPDTMAGLGLSAASLLELNPALVYAAGSGYGRSGPHRDFLAMDITVQAMSGVMSTNGEDGMPPFKTGPAICDFMGGIHLYGAIVTKLLERSRTGFGGIVDVSMEDAVLPTLATIIGAYYYGGRELQPRTGNRHPALSMSPYNVYAATDGHVAIICIRDGHWRALAGVMAIPGLAEREDLATMAGRAERMQEVDTMVARWTGSLPRQEIVDQLQAVGVPSAVVRNVEEVIEDEHLRARGMLREVAHPALGDIVLPDSPLNVAMGRPVEATLPPALGEHSRSVLGEMLGLEDGELDVLVANGVVRDQ